MWNGAGSVAPWLEQTRSAGCIPVAELIGPVGVDYVARRRAITEQSGEVVDTLPRYVETPTYPKNYVPSPGLVPKFVDDTRFTLTTDKQPCGCADTKTLKPFTKPLLPTYQETIYPDLPPEPVDLTSKEFKPATSLDPSLYSDARTHKCGNCFTIVKVPVTMRAPVYMACPYCRERLL